MKSSSSEIPFIRCNYCKNCKYEDELSDLNFLSKKDCLVKKCLETTPKVILKRIEVFQAQFSPRYKTSYYDNNLTVSYNNQKSIATSSLARRRRVKCGNCEECRRPNCGVCIYCIDKMQDVQKLKKACIHKKCKKLQLPSTKVLCNICHLPTKLEMLDSTEVSLNAQQLLPCSLCNQTAHKNCIKPMLNDMESTLHSWVCSKCSAPDEQMNIRKVEVETFNERFENVILEENQSEKNNDTSISWIQASEDVKKGSSSVLQISEQVKNEFIINVPTSEQERDIMIAKEPILPLIKKECIDQVPVFKEVTKHFVKDKLSRKYFGDYTRLYKITIDDYKYQVIPPLQLVPKGLIKEFYSMWRKNKDPQKEWSSLLHCIRSLSDSNMMDLPDKQLTLKVMDCLNELNKVNMQLKKDNHSTLSSIKQSYMIVADAPFWIEPENIRKSRYSRINSNKTVIKVNYEKEKERERDKNINYPSGECKVICEKVPKKASINTSKGRCSKKISETGIETWDEVMELESDASEHGKTPIEILTLKGEPLNLSEKLSSKPIYISEKGPCKLTNKEVEGKNILLQDDREFEVILELKANRTDEMDKHMTKNKNDGSSKVDKNPKFKKDKETFLNRDSPNEKPVDILEKALGANAIDQCYEFLEVSSLNETMTEAQYDRQEVFEGMLSNVNSIVEVKSVDVVEKELDASSIDQCFESMEVSSKNKQSRDTQNELELAEKTFIESNKLDGVNILDKEFKSEPSNSIDQHFNSLKVSSLNRPIQELLTQNETVPLITNVTTLQDQAFIDIIENELGANHMDQCIQPGEVSSINKPTEIPLKAVNQNELEHAVTKLNMQGGKLVDILENELRDNQMDHCLEPVEVCSINEPTEVLVEGVTQNITEQTVTNLNMEDENRFDSLEKELANNLIELSFDSREACFVNTPTEVPVKVVTQNEMEQTFTYLNTQNGKFEDRPMLENEMGTNPIDEYFEPKEVCSINEPTKVPVTQNEMKQTVTNLNMQVGKFGNNIDYKLVVKSTNPIDHFSEPVKVSSVDESTKETQYGTEILIEKAISKKNMLNINSRMSGVIVEKGLEANAVETFESNITKPMEGTTNEIHKDKEMANKDISLVRELMVTSPSVTVIAVEKNISTSFPGKKVNNDKPEFCDNVSKCSEDMLLPLKKSRNLFFRSELDTMEKGDSTSPLGLQAETTSELNLAKLDILKITETKASEINELETALTTNKLPIENVSFMNISVGCQTIDLNSFNEKKCLDQHKKNLSRPRNAIRSYNLLKRAASYKKKYLNIKTKLYTMDKRRENFVNSANINLCELFSAYDEDYSKMNTLSRLNDELSSSKRELSGMKDKMVEWGKEKLGIMADRIEKSKKIIHLKEEVNKMQNEITELKSLKPEFIKLQKEIEELRIKKSEVIKLQKEIEDLKIKKSEIIKLQNENEELKTTKSEVIKLQKENEELKSKKSEVMKLQKENEELKSKKWEVIKLQREIEELKAKKSEIIKLQIEIEELKTRNPVVIKLQKEIEELKAKKPEVIKLQKEIEELKTKKPEVVTMVEGKFTPEVNSIFKKFGTYKVPVEKIPSLVRYTVEKLVGLKIAELPFESCLSEFDKDDPNPLSISNKVNFQANEEKKVNDTGLKAERSQGVEPFNRFAAKVNQDISKKPKIINETEYVKKQGRAKVANNLANSEKVSKTHKNEISPRETSTKSVAEYRKLHLQDMKTIKYQKSMNSVTSVTNREVKSSHKKNKEHKSKVKDGGSKRKHVESHKQLVHDRKSKRRRPEVSSIEDDNITIEEDGTIVVRNLEMLFQ